MTDVARPRPISAFDALDSFDCGIPELDIWLKQRALSNDMSGASRTFVAIADKKVMGYYAMTVGSLEHIKAPGKIRRNMLDPIPVAILARLAIDRQFQGKGWGEDLLLDAVAKVVMAAETLGIRALLIHALSENARAFYERHNFIRSPMEDMTLMANLSDLRKVLS
jgi:GNAT superfamily N-acetyltransferase